MEWMEEEHSIEKKILYIYYILLRMLHFVDIMVKPPNQLNRKIKYHICRFFYPPYTSQTIEVMYDDNEPDISISNSSLLFFHIGLTCLILIIFISWLIIKKLYFKVSVSYLWFCEWYSISSLDNQWSIQRRSNQFTWIRWIYRTAPLCYKQPRMDTWYIDTDCQYVRGEL